jgi:SAM-dependent MidA family methyltransferase
MQQALYHPEHGYYSSGRAAIGRHGDYFTNVSVGALFGQLLGAQFAEVWEYLGKFNNFVIVEQGAHDGALARDVLEFARTRFPRFFAALRYEIVEPFPVLQDRQSKTLAGFADKVNWSDSIENLAPFVGLHFSNELLDSMPVHLLVSGKDGWREKSVDLRGDEFVFVERPITDSRLANPPARPPGEAEINLAALDWIDSLASKLQKGFVVVIDYGFAREEFYAPNRTTQTLQVRAQHRRLRSPLDEIGRADITTHVDWTSLVERAQTRGLQLYGFTDQHHFITGIITELAALPEDSKAKRALQTLLHPEMLGRAFQVLALTKDIELTAPLAGFKFTRDAAAALGL